MDQKKEERGNGTKMEKLRNGNGTTIEKSSVIGTGMKQKRNDWTNNRTSLGAWDNKRRITTITQQSWNIH